MLAAKNEAAFDRIGNYDQTLGAGQHLRRKLLLIRPRQHCSQSVLNAHAEMGRTETLGVGASQQVRHCRFLQHC
jgi:hypothetical protein